VLYGPALAVLAVAASDADVVLVLGGVLIGSRIEGEDRIAIPTTSTTIAPDATVTLEPKGAIDATGTVAMFSVEGGSEQLMSVDVSQLPPAAAGSFYEVWLLQPDTGQMLAVGVLPNGGSASFALPAGIVANYQAVDVSLQPDDGGVVHSGNSVLRATYA
jgi:anti-sigma-K factor RskA